MIGYGYRKLARELGLNCASGVAYGCIDGLAVTLNEGLGYKEIFFTDAFPQQVLAELEEEEIRRNYRIQEVLVSPGCTDIVFHDTVGTLKVIRGFLNWLLPRLRGRGHICGECGLPMETGCWKLFDGVAYHIHPGCAEHMQRKLESERREDRCNGTYLSGALGAFLGALVGAGIWTAVLMMGYMAAVVGLAIGWLSMKGYELFQGKPGYGKLWILVAALILGVVLGTFGADFCTLARMLRQGQLMGLGYGDLPGVILELLKTDGEYLEITMVNILAGLVFGGLGFGSVLVRIHRGLARIKIIDLP